MAKSLAVEYGQHGIRVNFQGPGATETNMLDQAIEDVTAFRKTHLNDKMPSKMQGPLNRNQTSRRTGRSSLFSAIGCILCYDRRHCCSGLWYYSLLGSNHTH
jgi:NAD(P)-dependent dehydrogenase (short-subunit alcohol dehydrogenase family)